MESSLFGIQVPERVVGSYPTTSAKEKLNEEKKKKTKEVTRTLARTNFGMGSLEKRTT